MFNCTITTTTGNIHVVNMQWRRAGASSPAAVYLYTNHPPQSFDGFTTNGYSIPPNTLTSTATLTGAQFSHNNYVLECFSTSPVIQPPRSLNETVVIEGMLPVCIHSCLISVYYLHIGASTFPLNLNIISPTALTWLPPAGDLNCSFNYTINITRSLSVTEQMHVPFNSTSLILTDLMITRGENYSFAVAVTDSTGQHGPWSEELSVTWDGEYYIYDHI